MEMLVVEGGWLLCVCVSFVRGDVGVVVSVV